MIRAFFSGREGLRAQQTAMDTIANNIANANTVAFKAKQTEFGDLLHSSLVLPDAPGYATQLTGNGVAVTSTSTDMSRATPYETGGSTDFCPMGDGFFTLADEGGNTFYTRDGSFSVTPGQGGPYLRSAQGLYVLDAQGNRITAQGGTLSAQPGAVAFANAAGLSEQGGGIFAQTDLSGAPQASQEELRRGWLEGSNVDMAREMSGMIVTQRSYQMSSKVVQTADEIESMVNALKD